MALFALLVAACLPLGSAQALPSEWKEWGGLVGEWVADAGGPDAPTGSFAFAPELQGRVLVRHSFAEYPKSKERPASRHDDLMVVYHQGTATRADYYDSEGHVIRYAVKVTPAAVTFLSDPQPGAPRFRLTYTMAGADSLALAFEMAPPGSPDSFAPYIKATAHRKR